MSCTPQKEERGYDYAAQHERIGRAIEKRRREIEQQREKRNAVFVFLRKIVSSSIWSLLKWSFWIFQFIIFPLIVPIILLIYMIMTGKI